MIIQEEDDDDAAEAIAAGLIGFTAGIAIGAAMDNHYYYGPYGWHGGAYMYNDAWDDYYDAAGRCARGLDGSPRRPCRGTQRSGGGPAGEPDGPRGEYTTATHRPPGDTGRKTGRRPGRRRTETRPERAEPDDAGPTNRADDTGAKRLDTERERESCCSRGSSRPEQRDPGSSRVVNEPARTRSRAIRAAHLSAPPAPGGSKAAAAAPRAAAAHVAVVAAGVGADQRVRREVQMSTTNRSDEVRRVMWRSLAVWCTCALIAAPMFSSRASAQAARQFASPEDAVKAFIARGQGG